VEDLTETQKDVSENAKENTKQLGILGKAAKGLQAGFKGIGLALKAAGIGLIIKAFDVLVEIFKENQVVVDLFNTSFNFLSLAFNDFFNFIQRNIAPITGYFKELFNDPMAKVRELGDVIKGYLVNAFKQVLNAMEAFGGAINALFAGEWKAAVELAKEGGRELVDAFVGVEEGGVEILSNCVRLGMTKLKLLPSV